MNGLDPQIAVVLEWVTTEVDPIAHPPYVGVRISDPQAGSALRTTIVASARALAVDKGYRKGNQPQWPAFRRIQTKRPTWWRDVAARKSELTLSIRDSWVDWAPLIDEAVSAQGSTQEVDVVVSGLDAI